MAPPIRNIGQAPQGASQATPAPIRRRLAVKMLKLTGARGGRRG